MCDVTTLALGLIQPHTRLDYLLPRAILISSSADHPKKTKSLISVYIFQKECEVSILKGMVSKLISSKEQILVNYSDFFMVLDTFLVLHTISRSIPVSHPNKPSSTNTCTSKESFKKEIDKMLQVGVLNPVNQATP